MVVKKRQSKRVTMQNKFKKQKKIQDFKRKAKKLARANGVVAKPKKDPGVPNLWPFKQQLLEKVQQAKEAEKKLSDNQKEAKRLERERKRQAAVRAALNQDNEHDVYTRGQSFSSMDSREQADVQRRRWYRKELAQVVESADVILEVLDARDPEGCRCLDVERKIINSQSHDGSEINKKLVLVLNKIDLVPPPVVEAWLKRLRREYPVIAFRANTQKQQVLSRSHRHFDADTTADDMGQSTGMNRDKLIHALKQYCGTGVDENGGKLSKFIRVGVIGYPNVGKSSIINTLKGRRSAATGPTPGVTKTLQRISLGGDMELIDSPGVLFAAGGRHDAELVLRNCLRVEQLRDPVQAVELLVNKFPRDELTRFFRIGDNWRDPEQFIAAVAIQKGKLAAGGVPNMLLAARAILADWNSGKIPYYTMPAKDLEAREDAMHYSERIVSGFSKEFNIDALDELNKGTLQATVADLKKSAALQQQQQPPRFIQMHSSKPMEMLGDDDEDASEDDEDEDDGEGMMNDEDEEDEEDEQAPQLVEKQFALGRELPHKAPRQSGKKGAASRMRTADALLDDRNDLLDGQSDSEDEGRRPQIVGDMDADDGQQRLNAQRNKGSRKEQQKQQRRARRKSVVASAMVDEDQEMGGASAASSRPNDDFDWSSFQ